MSSDERFKKLAEEITKCSELIGESKKNYIICTNTAVIRILTKQMMLRYDRPKSFKRLKRKG